MMVSEREKVSTPATSRVEDLLQQMTLAEKIGQMTQVDQRAVQPDDVTRYYLGSVLSGGGSNPTPNNPQNWADMVSTFQQAAQQTRLGIPLIYGVDAVHGHSNVVGATIFPHNIGLGATRDAKLVERVARATALETSATGVYWDFAPCVAVPQDIRWGRTYEGFSENTDVVVELGAAYVRGLQGVLGAPGSVLACPKHFVGDGGTIWGSTQQYEWLEDYWQAADQRYQIDQGNVQLDESTLRQVHLAPYLTAIQAGARSIMVSFSSWNSTKMHAHHYLLTEVLKGEYGFSGFLVSDWRAIDQLSADPYERVVLSINAGLDMIMVPFEYQPFMNNLRKAVQAGDVPIDRINDAVRRILAVKEELGLFERKQADEPRPISLGNVEHRQLAREAVRKSLVLLKNENSALPIPRDITTIAMAGPAADDIGLQCGGWTIEWLGGTGNITPGTTLLQAMQNRVSPATTVHFDPLGNFSADFDFDLGIVCLHEMPYAEGVGDRADLNLKAEEISLLAKVRSRCRRLVVIIFSGRPLIITGQLPLADAVVAAWLPGTEGQGIADVLLGDYPFTGKLPYSWPRAMAQVPFDFPNIPSAGCAAPLFPHGYGLQT